MDKIKKKKIGILTLPLHNNYGGLLQAFALQKVIENIGHDVLLIDGKTTYSSRFRKMIWLVKQYVLNFLKGTPVIQPDWTTLQAREIIGQHTNRFVKEHIKTTKKLPAVISFSAIEHYGFEGYVVGSDQVWRPPYTPMISNYFFDFVEHVPNVKRIAYSASFGKDEWLFTPEETIRCADLVKKFDAIAVREDSGILLCKEKFGVDAVKELDPTLLLSKEEYENLVHRANVPVPKGNMFTYVLDKSVDNDAIIERAARVLGLTPFIIMPKKNMAELTKDNMDSYVFPPVTEWINGFMNAEFIITDSFHGTLFSIIFNKPFISIGNKRRGLSRFTSILEMLGLKERLVLSIEDLTDNLLTSQIDYGQVNKVLEIKRKKSIEFLTKALQ